MKTIKEPSFAADVFSPFFAGIVALIVLFGALPRLGDFPSQSDPLVPGGRDSSGILPQVPSLRDAIGHEQDSGLAVGANEYSEPSSWNETNISAFDAPFEVLYDPMNGDIYVFDYATANLSVLDPRTASIVSWIPIGGGTGGMVLDPNTGEIFISGSGSNVFVVNGTTNTVTSTVEVGSMDQNFVTPDTFDDANDLVYAALVPTDNISAVNSTSLVANVTVPGMPGWGAGPVVYDTRTNQLYVEASSNATSNDTPPIENVYLVNGTSNHIGGKAQGVQPVSQMDYVAPVRNIYMAGEWGNLTVLSDVSNKVVALLPLSHDVLGGQLAGEAYDGRNGVLYVTNTWINNTAEGDTVTAVNTTWNTVVGTIPVQHQPEGIAYDDGTNQLFVAEAGSGHVTSISLNKTYRASFVESGLSADTNWSVTLDGISESSERTPVNFSLQYGSYQFSVTPEPGYIVSPQRGILNLTGYDLVIPVVFSPPMFAVDLSEAGLPAGTNWSVSIPGETAWGTGATLQFAEPNGTYPFTLGLVPGYHASPELGSFLVHGAAVLLSVTFSPVGYLVSLEAEGLPPGTNWSLCFAGRCTWSTSASFLLEEPNGTYPYAIGLVPGFRPSPGSGAVQLDGAPVALTIEFTVNEYAVTLTQVGLPAGMNWSVCLGGECFWSTLASLVVEEPNGSYSFVLGRVSGFGGTPETGRLHVNGTSATALFQYSPLPPSSSGSTPSSWQLAILLALVFIAAFELVALISLRRRKRGGERPDSPKGPSAKSERPNKTKMSVPETHSLHEEPRSDDLHGKGTDAAEGA